jgi:hypothetical protein
MEYPIVEKVLAENPVPLGADWKIEILKQAAKAESAYKKIQDELIFQIPAEVRAKLNMGQFHKHLTDGVALADAIRELLKPL